MRSPFRLSGMQGAILLALMTAPLHAFAEGIVDIRPYVSATSTYDDNLFRFTGKDEARLMLGTETMSDTMTRTEAGVDVDWTISRQHVRLGLNYNQNRFNRFNFLDNNGNSKNLAWDWVLGSYVGGELSVSEIKSMGGFTEIQNPVLNQRTAKRRVMNVHWDLHPSWRLIAQRDETESKNSSEAYRSSDRTDTAHEAAIQYTTSAGNRLALSVREVESEYPSRDVFQATVFGNGNMQRDVALNALWNLTGKTRLSGRVAHLARRYEELSERDVKDWTARLGMDWQATGKTSVSMSVAHDIYGIDDIAATYVQSDILSISPTWVATSKVMVQARASYEKRSYLGDPGFLLGQAHIREDKLKSAGLTVTYVPHEKVRLQVGWQKDERDSTSASTGYDDQTLSANVRIDF